MSLTEAPPGVASKLIGVDPKKQMEKRALRHYGFAQFCGILVSAKPGEQGKSITQCQIKIQREHDMERESSSWLSEFIVNCDTLVTIICVRFASVIARCSKPGHLVMFPRCQAVPPAQWLCDYMLNLSAYRSREFTTYASRPSVAKHVEEYVKQEKEENLDPTKDKSLWDW
jgi:hypothetical protein